MQGFPWLPTLMVSAGSAAIMIFGGVLTDTGPWYRSLKKPDWQPPGWLFAPAWTLIYILVTAGTVMAWNNTASTSGFVILLLAFALNGLLNVGWSLVFFKWRRPDQAQFEVVALWLSTALLAAVCYNALPLAGWLIAPYVAWVAFAAYLNRTVVRLNAPSSREVRPVAGAVAGRAGS